MVLAANAGRDFDWRGPQCSPLLATFDRYRHRLSDPSRNSPRAVVVSFSTIFAPCHVDNSWYYGADFFVPADIPAEDAKGRGMASPPIPKGLAESAADTFIVLLFSYCIA